MDFEEYKKLYEDILEISEVVEKLFKAKKFEEVKEPFEKRFLLVEKLTEADINLEELDDEKFQQIADLAGQIKEKNEFILKAMQLQKMELKKEMINVRQEQDITEAYQIKSSEKTGNSIFDI